MANCLPSASFYPDTGQTKDLVLRSGSWDLSSLRSICKLSRNSLPSQRRYDALCQPQEHPSNRLTICSILWASAIISPHAINISGFLLALPEHAGGSIPQDPSENNMEGTAQYSHWHLREWGEPGCRTAHGKDEAAGMSPYCLLLLVAYNVISHNLNGKQ